MNVVSVEEKVRVISALVEGNSIRSIERFVRTVELGQYPVSWNWKGPSYPLGEVTVDESEMGWGIGQVWLWLQRGTNFCTLMPW